MTGYDCDLAGLFEGYGGLTMGVQAAVGGELGWYSEHEPPAEKNPNPTQAAARLLTHRHPELPNLGDVAQVDWSAVPRPRVLTGGFPCQDVSSAGRRIGMRPGTRSGLWSHMAYAIDQLRPALVVIENVRGLLSADAACDVEPCPWCLGDGEGRPLRALGAVLGDLVQLGYDARWGGLRASDVGAPHGRFRVFVAAWPRGAGADAVGIGCRPARGDDGLRASGLVPAAPSDTAGQGWGSLLPFDVADVGGTPIRAGKTEPRRWDSQAAPDPNGVGSVRDGGSRGRRGGPADHDRAAADAAGAGGRRDVSVDAAGDRAASDGRRQAEPRRRGGTAAHPVHDGRQGCTEHDGQPVEAGQLDARGDAAGRLLDWGAYEPAIRRWELILGRPAPAPTMTGKKGGQQLSPRFVEWMQGLPEGWVTDVPGLTRNEQLKMLGNGVVPQQAEAAVRWLLAPAEEAAA